MCDRRTLVLASLLLLLLTSLLCVTARLSDPYNTLGVDRHADISTIKRAYKRLARIWHPDKNSAGDAKSRFVDITGAYELLSDPMRRRRFDLHGIVEDSPNFRRPHTDSPIFDARFDAWTQSSHRQHDRHRGGGGMDFGDFLRAEAAGAGAAASLRRDAISLRHFERHVAPDSWRRPTLLLTFTDWCAACVHAQPLWARLCERLPPVGVATATVHAHVERRLAVERLGASDGAAPQLFLVADGRSYAYHPGSGGAVEMSVSGVVEFVRARLSRLAESSSAAGRPLLWRLDASLAAVAEFVAMTADSADDMWRDNRVRALVFSQSATPKLRYTLLAFKYRSRVAVGFVYTGASSGAPLLAAYGVSATSETLSIFKEHPAETAVNISTSNVFEAAASVSMSPRLSFEAMCELMERHQFLTLPRLSSQALLDQLCPVEPAMSRRRLCAVLVEWSDGGGARKTLDALRLHVQRSALSRRPGRARYVYMYGDRQAAFLQALSPGCPRSHAVAGLMVIVWRVSEHQLHYEWLPRDWTAAAAAQTPPIAANDTLFMSVDARLRRLLTSTSSGEDVKWLHAVDVRPLRDEHAPGLLRRVLARLYGALDFVGERVSRDQLLPAASVVVTVAVLAAGGYVMSHLAKLEEANVQRQYRSQGGSAAAGGGCGGEASTVSTQLRVHELRAETFNGLVRLLKPGCRTLVLMVDSDSRDKLVGQFRRIVWPYRRNRTLMFAFMLLERGLAWYRRLLQPHLPDNRQLNINPKNCIGTVISINGHRKYFCMYHAKHAEAARTRGRTSRARRQQSRRLSPSVHAASGGGEFLGFNSSSGGGGEDSGWDVERAAPSDHQDDQELDVDEWLCHSDDDVLFEKQLLDALPAWLDRLFEGQTVRYHLNFWPDFVVQWFLTSGSQ